MAITGGFFNSLNGDRKYYAEDVNTFFEGLVGSGVFQNVGGGLRVTADGSGMLVYVQPGKLVDSRGFWLKNDSVLILGIDPSDVLMKRRDRIVATIDSSSGKRDVTISVKKGTPVAVNSSYPVIKPTRTAYVEEYVLANVEVKKGATLITQANVQDLRPNNYYCGWVTGLIEQLDLTGAFEQYEKAGEEQIESNQEAFDAWFGSVKETLASSTLIRSYYNSYTTTQENETDIPIEISQYNENLDILQVYINGLRLSPGGEYSVLNNQQIRLANAVKSGTKISFEVFKSVDGSDAETVVSQVAAMQAQMDKFQYVANGTDDNTLLSQMIQSFLNGGDDYKQIEIDVIGAVGCTEPYSGDGSASRPYLWFALGKGTSTTRKVRVNFAKCDRITVDSSSYSGSVLFGGNDIFMTGCQAVMNNAQNGRIFNGERVLCKDSEFWLNGTGNLVGGGCCGTFEDCRMSVTSGDGTAAGFSANGNILRLDRCEILAYNLTSASGEANGVVVEAGKTENVLIMNGCNLPITARNGYKQTNTVKINNGYYCLTGNILGKVAAKYASGEGKTETGTMIISK